MGNEKANHRAAWVRARAFFDAGDDLFVEALREVQDPQPLVSFARTWLGDHRPFARGALFEYLAGPLNCPGHQTLVKRLFKGAEAAHDAELMGAFLVAFDRLIRRQRKTRWRWSGPGDVWREQYLYQPRNTIVRGLKRTYTDWRGREVEYEVGYSPARDRLFGIRTRDYLRRRAWRWFRHLGYRDPAAYRAALVGALRRYQDEDLAQGEHILDSWGLVQACFHHHPALRFTTSRVHVAEGHRFGDLEAAPRFEDTAWADAAAVPSLLELLRQAEARLVRVWALQLLRRHHRDALAALPVDEIVALVTSPDPAVQALGVELLELVPDLGQLPLETWMQLLAVEDLATLQQVCTILEGRVAPETFTVDQLVEMVTAEAAPLASVGLALLQRRPLGDADLDALVQLAEARSPQVAGPAASFALEHLAAPERYAADAALRFFDARRRETREAAWAWLTPESAGYSDPLLWARLTETPYDDLRLCLVDALEQRARLPGADADDLERVWCSVLLGVHRGGRQKAKAVDQVGRALRRRPEAADRLLPVMAVAVRSVRGPEHRAGLAAVVEAVEARPELAHLVQAVLPELELDLDGGAA